MAVLQYIEYWHWLVLGLLLAILEVFSPGVFFLWIGIGAGLTGLMVWLFPEIGWQWQLVVFAGLSVASIVVARNYLVRHPIESDQPALNRRGEQYVDRVFTLEQPIVNGSGKIRVDDSTWKVRGEDCAAGTRVRVCGVDGVVLLVEVLD